MITSKFYEPNFLGIGVQKAGSSWLYEALNEHPEFDMPPLKELHFFDYIDRKLPNKLVNKLNSKNWMVKRWMRQFDDFFYDSGKDQMVNEEWFKKYLLLHRDFNEKSIESYAELFNSNKVSGDITPNYATLSLKTIKTIRTIFPQIKIILVLRNPIDREWSMTKMYFRNNFNKTVKQIPKQKILNYLNKTYRRSQILNAYKNWKVHFQDDLGLFFYDDLCKNPREFLNNILKFLNIDPTIKKDYEVFNKEINASTFKSDEFFEKNFKQIICNKHYGQIKRLNEEVNNDITQFWKEDVEKFL